MTVSDYESKLDEMERDNLQKAISEVERTLASSGTQKPMPLANFVENAKGRIAALDRKIKESQAERESRAREQVAIAHLAQKEAALSASEKETYSGFLSKEFFTKNDFGSLETFYAQTWDRLSESGKDEMSHRVWEGVRRDEYKFSELPATVREKEMERAYGRLRSSAITAGDTVEIPKKDRDDFIRVYEGGNRQEASKVLDRESFKANMFRGQDSAVREHVAADRGRTAEKASIANEALDSPAGDTTARTPAPANKADLNLSNLNLGDLQMTDAKSHPSSSEIPNARPADASQRQSTRGG